MAGTGDCEGGFSVWLCANTIPESKLNPTMIQPDRNTKPILEEKFISGYDDGVARLELHVLFQFLALDDVLVVEGQLRLGSVRVLAEHVDRFLLREIPEAAGNRDRIQHRGRAGQRIRTRARHHS